MNFIRPTTFVEAPRLASATFGLAALAVAFLGLTQANAALRDGAARSSLARAEAMPRGIERDAALARSLFAIEDAVKAAPQDARTHALAARAFYLQATTAAVDEVSAPLLGAARRAAVESARRSPANAEALALSALIDIAANGGAPDAAAARNVTQSYAAPAGGDGALWRLEAAVQTWPALDVGVQQAVIEDACMRAAGDRAFAAGLAQATALLPDSGLDRCTPAPSAL